MQDDKQKRRYLKKFENDFKVKFNDDQVYVILCKFGEIDLLSLDKKILLYSHFGTGRKMTFIQKSLKEKFSQDKIKIQKWDSEGFFEFGEDRLLDYSNILEIRKRRKYTPKVLYMLRQNLAKNKKSCSKH